jgi:peptidoglycan/LPS O-acetylase OafA/YrhL
MIPSKAQLGSLIPSGRLPPIDALRGLAAVIVIWVHNGGLFTPFNGAAVTETVVNFFFKAGLMTGVPIFFVLSGFVVAVSTASVGLSFRDVPAFLLRRLVRLAPPYWFAIGLMIAALTVRALVSNQYSFDVSFAELAANLFYVQGIIGVPNINGVFWTLTIELQFYLVFALAFATAKTLELKSPKLGVIATSIFFVISCVMSAIAYICLPETIKHQSFISYWFQFLLGICAYEVLSRRSALLIVTSIMVLVGCLVFGVSQADGFTLSAVATSMFIIGLGYGNKLSSALDHKPLQFLGKISYSIYLVHVPIILVANGIRSRFYPGVAIISWAFCCASMLLILGTALLTYRYFEMPGIRLSKRLKDRMRLNLETVSS